MARYFLEFVSLQHGKSGDSEQKRITVTIKLFSNSMPSTTKRLAQLFFPECNNGDDQAVTYRKSQVTRVIAPEYLVQFGKPVRRSAASLDRLFGGDCVFDCDEIEALGDAYHRKVQGRTGLVCVAERFQGRDSGKSLELCIVFVPWGQHRELDGYTVVGECKEWKALRTWMSGIDVCKDATGSWEVPTGDGVWVDRCGRLLEEGEGGLHQEAAGKRRRKTTPGKVRAVDLLFKRPRRK